MKKFLLPSIILLFIIYGCSDPKVDASSDESIKTSIEQVRQSLNQEKKNKFDEALKILAFSQIDFKTLLAEGASGVGTTEIKMKAALDGKTGDEIILEAERIKKLRKEKERAQAVDEIRELTAKKEKSIKAKKALENFRVIRSRFYKQEQTYGSPKPVIELSVINWTTLPVSRVYFKGTLASPNRSIPWLTETFNYQIPGGIEPGEEAEWSLAPNMFSDWGKVRAPSDAILTVEVVRLDGVDGKALFSSRVFSKSDAERLEKLKKEYDH